MTRRPYSPTGPRRMRCLICGVVISTNALGRAAHERGQHHQDELERRHRAEVARQERRLARRERIALARAIAGVSR